MWRRREFCGLLPGLALAGTAVQVAAAAGEGSLRWKELRYAGVVAGHESIPRGAVAVEIRLDSYDAKTGLPPRELIERVATAASAKGAERLIVNGRACYDGRLDRAALTSKCIALNQAGRFCLSKRLGFRYRNGRGEFGGNALEMEETMLRTNPEVVGVAMDAAEAHKAGADMVNFFARHQTRMDCIFIHEWDTVPYAKLAAEIARRQWQGWLVQSPASAQARRAVTRIFGV